MKKKLAIVGYGGQGAWHGGWAEKSDCIELSGIYDIRAERCKLAKERGIRVYDSLSALLSDESVDIVLCATPNESHKDICIAALRAGKHVVCEKPVTLCVADFDEIVDTAKKYNKHFSVHQNRRWDVDYLAVKGLIDSGEIGDVINIESRSHGSRGCPPDWRLHKPSGGMMLDWGVHLIDQIMLLIPERLVGVYCEMTNITTDEVDDGFNLKLTYESGKRATVEVGTYNFINLPRMYMQCRGGTAYIEEWRSNTKVAKLKNWQEKENERQPDFSIYDRGGIGAVSWHVSAAAGIYRHSGRVRRRSYHGGAAQSGLPRSIVQQSAYCGGHHHAGGVDLSAAGIDL